MSKPIRSRQYLAYIRSLPCTVCQRRNGVEAHHVGNAGMSRKRSDTETIPLCRAHHREWHHIGKLQFLSRYDLNIPELLRTLQAKPAMSIESGNVVARIEAREYIVGSVRMGMDTAFRRVQQIWWEDRKHG